MIILLVDKFMMVERIPTSVLKSEKGALISILVIQMIQKLVKKMPMINFQPILIKIMALVNIEVFIFKIMNM